MNEENFILNSKTQAIEEQEMMDFQMNYSGSVDDQISIKYSKLIRKCEQIKMENFRLINYIDQINKLVRKVRKQNAFICTKLDQNNDDYHIIKPSILHEIELVINYGKTKLKKESSNKSKSLNKAIVEDKNTGPIVDHRNKRIKIDNKLDENHSMNNQIAINMESNNLINLRNNLLSHLTSNSGENLSNNLASNLPTHLDSNLTSNNLAYHFTNNSSLSNLLNLDSSVKQENN